MDLTQGNWEKQLNSELNGGAVIIDVRTPEEFEVSRIPNSINIDFYNAQKFITKIDKLDRDCSYYIYCRTGARSSNSCIIMKEMGFKKTYNLTGGISDWKGKIIK